MSQHDHKHEHDAFIGGLKKQANQPILLIDPNKFDRNKLEIALNNGDTTSYIEQITEQFRTQNPEILKLLSPHDLAYLTQRSLVVGPARMQLPADLQVCIINLPDNKNANPNSVFDAMHLTQFFSQEHFKDLSAIQADLDRLVGEHEGSHCGHRVARAEKDLPLDKKIQILKHEAGADKAAVNSLLKDGKEDVVNIWIALRILGAANEDHNHGTSIFIKKNSPENITEEHYRAIERFEREMNLTVAQGSNMSEDQARKLRTADPQKYANLLEAAMNTGHYPAQRPIEEDKVMDQIAERMNISTYSLKYGKNDIDKINKAYNELKKEGKLSDTGNPNPYIKEHITLYISATRIVFGDTSKPGTTPPMAAALELGREQIAEQSFGHLKPANQRNKLLAERLNIKHEDLPFVPEEILKLNIEALDREANSKTSPNLISSTSNTIQPNTNLSANFAIASVGQLQTTIHDVNMPHQKPSLHKTTSFNA